MISLVVHTPVFAGQNFEVWYPRVPQAHPAAAEPRQNDSAPVAQINYFLFSSES